MKDYTIKEDGTIEFRIEVESLSAEYSECGSHKIMLTVVMDPYEYRKLTTIATFDEKAIKLVNAVESNYQLGIEFDRIAGQWFAYYVQSKNSKVFDNAIYEHTKSKTPTEALNKLQGLVDDGKL